MNKSIIGSSFCFAVMFCGASALAVPLTQKEQLGKIMYQDKDFSFNGTQSCQSCHHHSAGYVDPANTRDPYVTVVSTGADGESLGGRNAPSSAYAGYSPTLYWDEEKGEYAGGMFWDGRATGDELGDPLAEQAQGPPTNPVEMGMENPEAVVQAVRDSSYANLFLSVYGQDSLNIVTDAYNYIGDAIAAYERSAEVQRFSSRYDHGRLTEEESHGLELFIDHCNSCHTISFTPRDGGEAVDIFTSYSYANIGIPANEDVPLEEPDVGLGYTIGSEIDTSQDGKFKIPTLRNIGVTAPYGHNGYFPTLRSILEFKNNRPDMITVPPEIEENISLLIGDMGMSSGDMDDLEQFLMALTDK